MSVKACSATGPFVEGVVGQGVVEAYQDYGAWDKTLETRLRGLESSREVCLPTKDGGRGVPAYVVKEGETIRILKEDAENAIAIWEGLWYTLGYPPADELATLTLKGRRVDSYQIHEGKSEFSMRPSLLAALIAHAVLSLFNARADGPLEITATSENSKDLSLLGFKPQGEWNLSRVEGGDGKNPDWVVQRVSNEQEMQQDEIDSLCTDWGIVDFKGFEEGGIPLGNIQQLPMELPKVEGKQALTSIKAHSAFFDPPGVISAIFSAITRIFRWFFSW